MSLALNNRAQVFKLDSTTYVYFEENVYKMDAMDAKRNTVTLKEIISQTD